MTTTSEDRIKISFPDALELQREIDDLFTERGLPMKPILQSRITNFLRESKTDVIGEAESPQPAFADHVRLGRMALGVCLLLAKRRVKATSYQQLGKLGEYVAEIAVERGYQDARTKLHVWGMWLELQLDHSWPEKADFRDLWKQITQLVAVEVVASV